MSTININPDAASIRVNSAARALLSVLAALNQGKFSKAVDQFDDHFKFTDHALALEFTDKRRDHAVVEWKLTSTQVLAYRPLQPQVSIPLQGATTVHVVNGRIRKWSDYYDQLSSRRTSLAAFFTEWIE